MRIGEDAADAPCSHGQPELLMTGNFVDNAVVSFFRSRLVRSEERGASRCHIGEASPARGDCRSPHVKHAACLL